ncbi:MAG TPA: amino acid adenylation domain-containing protein [Actinomycetota bacterium]|nr:amino acid adenylation domain-containing protein [Actinomycetota bacterium]
MAAAGDVAIIGMGCLFPGASDAGSFHANLASGTDSVSDVSPERLKYTTIDPSRTYSRMGLLDRIDQFDYRFFNISLKEAEFMDPQQRLMLELVLTAIENSGYRPSKMAGTPTGVYLSAPRPEYEDLLKQTDPLELLGNAPSALPGRVAYQFDFRGPAVSIDAGCCSSLVAVHQACMELRTGRSRFAVAGGLALIVVPEPLEVTQKFTEIMSPDGRCKAFDASADGAAAGEGGAVVVLKLLQNALEDGDHIHAVIKGSAVNQNGFRSNGLSAPSPAAQTEVITAAWEAAGIKPASVGYIEAHGSGTRLGDVLEVQGLNDAFAAYGPRDLPVPIGSVKTNIGHLDHAAGIAGLVKAVLAVENQVLYPSLHFQNPNPLIDWDSGPVRVSSELSYWEALGPRVAGVSSFSLAGTNVHMVVGQAPPRLSVGGRATNGGRFIVKVGGRTEESFRKVAELTAAQMGQTSHSLAEIAQTMTAGRDDHRFRAATVVKSVDDLEKWLTETGNAPAPRPSPPEARPLIFLFSGDVEFTAEDVESLERIPAFHRAAEEFRDILDGRASTRAVEVLFVHYCLHAALTRFGVRESAVAGTGRGNLAVRVVRDGLPLPEAVEVALQDPAQPPLDTERLEEMLLSVGPRHPIFIEMGAGGLLSREIERVGGEGIFDVRPVVRKDPYELVVELYMAGGKIDWDAYYEGAKIPKIEMPSYRFDRSRVWCREIGDDFTGESVRSYQVPESVAEAAVATLPMRGDYASESQRKVAAIWTDALKAESLSPDSDYFELGGTSITGLTVLDGIEREFGVRISFQDLYEHSTIEGLALHVEDLQSRHEVEALNEPPIVSISRDGLLPISIGQEQIWFLDKLHGESPLYNISFDLQLKGELDEQALRNSINALIDRHEILRTSFVESDGEARALIRPFDGLDIPLIDLSDLDAGERRAEAVSLFEAEATKAFDLTRGPLVRCALLRLSEEEHVLLMTFHHIVYDGWTPAIIHAEISELYQAQLEKREPSLEPLPIQYADYAAWQREWLNPETLETEVAYWKEHLAGSEEADMAFDHPRPAVQSFRGGMIDFEVPASLADRLRELSRREGVTLFTTMMAALATFVFRYSGSEDVVIGTPSAGRRRQELRNLIGYFNNMLPLRADMSGNPTFRELIHRMVNVVAGGLDHDEVPFEKIVEAIKPDRALSHNPIFQIAYTHQNAPYEEYHLPGLEIQTYGEGAIRGIAPGTAKFDLTIGVADQGGGALESYFEYALDLIEPETAERMLSHYMHLLESIVDDPGVTLTALGMTDASEKQKVIEFSATAAANSDGFVHRMIDAVAQATPDAEALEGPDGRFTYKELVEHANRLAHFLRKKGARRDAPVALLLPPGADLIAAQLAAMKSGGAYLPIDPVNPASRIAKIIEDSDASVAVTIERLQEKLPTGVTVVLLDKDSGEIGLQAADAPRVDDRLDSLAYVIFTSGSTGRPKGVAIEHRGLTNLVNWAIDEFQITPKDHASQIAGISFDATVWETWPPLCRGAKLTVIPEDSRRDPDELVDWVDAFGVTLCFAPTPMMELLLASERAMPESLRLLSAGGDKLLGRPSFGNPRVVTLYGPTETTCICTAAYVEPDLKGDPSDIGKPITGAKIYILDRDLNPAPIGVPGEICIGGAGVARGYLGLAGETAQRFVNDPISEDSADLIFRSGDKGRFLSDGRIEFLGRIDDQVKIRGFRVEPGEVAAALKRHPSVSDAVVVPVGEAAKRRLAAYFIGAAGPDELKLHLVESVPDYMVPAHFIKVEAFPFTPAGKIDKKALPAPEAPDRSEFEAPLPGAEEQLAAIWQEVLGVERVGRSDNFFELGGDSIVSIQVVSRAARAGLKIRPRDLFQHQTVEELATVASEVKSAARETDANLHLLQEKHEIDEVPVTATGLHQGSGAGSEGRRYPLSPVQRWALAKGFGRLSHFNQAVLVSLPPLVDRDRLEKALRRIVEIHETLRTALSLDELEVKAVADVPLFVAASEGEVQQAFESAQTSLDPTAGRMFAAALDEANSRLLLVAHHLAIDAVSWGVIAQDLQELYENDDVEIPTSTSYSDWVERLKDAAPDFESELEFWTAGGSVSALPVPHDFENGLNDQKSSEEIHVEVPTPLKGRDLEAALLAGLSICIHEKTGAAVRVDREGHGRADLFDEADLSRTVGWFTSIHPVVIEPGSPQEAFEEAKQILQTIPSESVGFGVLRYLHSDPHLRHQLEALPDPTISFNFLGSAGGAGRDGAAFSSIEGPLGPLVNAEAPRAHEIDVEVFEVSGVAKASFTYSANIHDKTTIESIAARFKEVVETLGKGPEPETLQIVEGAVTSNGAVAASSATLEGPPVWEPANEDEAEVLRRHPDSSGAVPLTSLQEGLLFHSLASQSGLYFEHVILELEGELDSGAYQKSWQEAVRAHPILRSAIEWEGLTRPYFVIEPKVDLQFVVHDWSSESDTEIKIASLIEESSREGIDFTKAPLMRLDLVKKSSSAHTVIWSHHHTLLDGWSAQLLIGGVMTAYEQLIKGTTPHLEGGDFGELVRWLGARDQTEAQRYYEQLFEGFETPTPIATGRADGSGYQMVEIELDEKVGETLDSFCRTNHLTPNSVVAGAWAMLIGSLTRSDDVVFGATTTLRPYEIEDVEQIAGLFINTVPVRVRIDPSRPVGEWLQNLLQEQAELREFAYAPLPQIQTWSGVKHGQPLFDSILVFENYPLDAVWDDDESTIKIDGRPWLERTNYPVTVVVAPGQRPVIRITFDRAAVLDQEAKELAERLGGLIETITRSATRPVGELSIATELEQKELIEEWNPAPVARHESLLIHELISGSAARIPGKPAVVFGGETITYAELESTSNRLAHRLIAMGAGPELMVGLSLGRSPSLIIAMLAVIKAGAAYVPLDLAYPKDRIEMMVKDSGVKLVLAGSSSLELDSEAVVFELQQLLEDSSSLPDTPPDSGVRENNLAYILFTSGSTGRPKGVAIEHRSVREFASWAALEFGDDLSSVMASTSVNFDISVFEILVTLSYGGKVHLVENALELHSLPKDSDITLVDMVPSAMAEVLEVGELPPSVKTVNLPGEPLKGNLVDRVYERSNAKRVYNLYGPTEDTTFSTYSIVEKGTDIPAIGRPISNSCVYLLDRNLNAVPRGFSGEVYIGGSGLSRGYINRPGLTAERFLPDPYGPAGSRMYKVGDLARIADTGELEFLGRLDNQVKIRGFRVELGEIESVLSSHSSVEEAVVVAKGDKDLRLVAYCRPALPDGATESLKSLCESKLPSYMVPAKFVSMDQFPMTPNGKVDRRALPEPGREVPAAATSVAPNGPAEELIAALWKEVLEVERFGATDDFFDLGGHSLTATRLVARLRSAFAVDVPIALAFDRPTIREQADALAELWGGKQILGEVALAYTEVQSMSEAEAERLLAADHGDLQAAQNPDPITDKSG